MRFGENRNEWPFPRIRSVGRRGAYLIAQGVLYLFYGYALASLGSASYAAILTLLAPIRIWGMVWMFVGLLALVTAVFPSWRKVHFEPVAFAALMALATVWSVGILLVYLLPGPQGDAPALVALLFASLMASTAVVAGWKESK